MRSAGYHVRVVAQEDLGWEENPPTLLEFMRRDLRWCQGNMQYWRFLSLPNLKPVSRYQLMLAILMFIGSPAWIGLLALATIALVSFDDPATIHARRCRQRVAGWVLVMWFSPKIASFVDLLLRPEERRAFGGAGRFTVNFVIETVYSILLCPILWISHTIFLVGLLFNREIGWIGQVRDDHAVPFRLALRDLWPQTLVGWVAIGLVLGNPAVRRCRTFSCLPAGRRLAIPFAMLTAWPALGRLAARIGIGRLPEETATPEDLLAVVVARDHVGAAGRLARLGVAGARRRQDRACHHPVISYLLRRQGAGRGDGPALWRLRPARRSGVRRRRPCRRSRRLVSPAWRAGRRGRAAARDGQGSQAAVRPAAVRLRSKRWRSGASRAGRAC